MIIDKDGQQVNKQQEKIDEKYASQDLKLQLLTLAKDVLQQKAAMRWETHQQIENVTIDKLIEETQKLYKFVTEK
jgi:hypothetical protein